MVVSLGSQRDTEMLCAITASVQMDCDRTRGVEMLVSSEVQAVLLTNGEAAAAEFVARGGTCQQASPAQRRYRFSQWPQRDGCERGIGRLWTFGRVRQICRWLQRFTAIDRATKRRMSQLRGVASAL
jgi:hypothetical protein